MPQKSINPFTGEELLQVPAHDAAAVQQRLEQAAQAFKEWRSTSFEHRAQLMLAAAQVLDDRAEHFARLITLEMGKPINDSRSEVAKCAACCRYYAENAATHLADEPEATEASASYIAFDPLGPVLAIMPWNFPFWQVFRFAAPALMAGNVGLLKHASNVPQCALAIEEVFAQAGFPKGCFTTLLIASKDVAAIIADPRIAAVTITGSEGAGRKVAEAAGAALKPHVLELGGSDAYLVLQDADVELAAYTCAKSRMINTGQSCIAAKRFLVHHSLQGQFVQLMQRHFEEMKYGDPMREDVTFGPLARPDLVETLHEQVQKSLAQGARLICGGKPIGKLGYEPTILTDVRAGMTVFDEETFGPVAAIVTISSDEEAVELANASAYGLGAAIFTQDLERARRLARRLEAGCVFINDFVKSDSRLPFGGVKASGYGRELSYLGIRAFVNAKTVWVK